jgi:hypothetical protein
MRHGTNWILAAAAAALLTSACGTDDSGIASGSGAQSAAGAGGHLGGAAGAGGGSGKGTTATASDICSGKGPIVTIPGPKTTGSYQTCTGSIAETRFVNALCTCKNASVTGYLRTRAFDSAQGTSVDLGGSVGINGTYLNSVGFSDIGGSFSIAGHDSLSLAGYVKTGADFRTQGSAKVAGYTNVGRNMWVGAEYTDLGPVTVKGDLHSSGTMLAIPLLVSGARYQESVSVPPPCPCEDKDILDVAALVADAKTHNDNATAGIVPSMFKTLIGYATATLPCGKFYIEGIGGIGNVIINVTGRAALFVDGSINNTGNLEFRLDPSAEIDVFIRDNLAITGRATFGQKERPAASRVYIGGDGNVMLVGDGEFVGNVYAPRSLVQAVGYGAFLGSLFARDFICPGYADFAFDLAIKHAGDPCTPVTPPGTCTQCGTCTGGTACVGGKCGPCRTDADCCSQLICSDGKCIEPGTIF